MMKFYSPALGSRAMHPASRDARPHSPQFSSPRRGFARLISATLMLAAAMPEVRAASSELIPAARLVDWTPGVSVGVPGGIPTNRTRILNVTQPPYNANRTGSANTAAAIQQAIDAAVPGDVVYIPAGTYRCEAQLFLGHGKNGVTIRGDGPATVLDVRAGVGIFVGSASDYNWAWPPSNNLVTAGLRKGSTTVNIANTSEFEVGRMIQFSFQNDPSLPVVGVGGGDYFRKQMCMLTSKTANSLTFTPALYDDYGAGALTARVHVARLHTEFVGIEDLTVDCSNTEAIYGIQFEQCYASWIKNVRVIRAKNYAFFLYDSLKCEIRGSFADQRNTEGTNGAGLLGNAISACLIEDNIFYKFFPLIEINQGSSGNVIGYNFCYDSDVFGGMGSAINSNHGPHNSYNLYEGNAAANIQSDGYFGGASRDTVYRNWFHGTSPAVQRGPTNSFNRFTREYNVVGNIFGTSAHTTVQYSFGNPNMGNGSWTGTAQPSVGRWWADWGRNPGPSGFQEKDLDVEATMHKKANYFWGSGIPVGEELGFLTMPDSLYRTSKPAWFGSMAWPPFNSASPAATFQAIPAGFRYLNPGSGTPGVLSPSYPNVGSTAPSNVRIRTIVN